MNLRFSSGCGDTRERAFDRDEQGGLAVRRDPVLVKNIGRFVLRRRLPPRRIGIALFFYARAHLRVFVGDAVGDIQPMGSAGNFRQVLKRFISMLFGHRHGVTRRKAGSREGETGSEDRDVFQVHFLVGAEWRLASRSRMAWANSPEGNRFR